MRTHSVVLIVQDTRMENKHTHAYKVINNEKTALKIIIIKSQVIEEEQNNNQRRSFT